MTSESESGPAGVPGPTRHTALPPFELAWRGASLLGVAALLLTAARRALRHLLLFPLACVLGFAAVLCAWAGLIELTGGEKFDDHPWV